MANILDLVTVGSGAVLTVDGDPAAGGGTAGAIGSIAQYNDGVNGFVYIKKGSANTAWEQVSTTAASGVINNGVAGRVTLYPATGNTLDDVYTQNSQSINIAIQAQPTRSAGIEYTIPNPGDAVTAASFVLTEGAQTINGDKTFNDDIIIQGDLTVNGTTTSINTTNTNVTDKLVTLNKGGAAASAGGSGIEFEENSVITGYLKQSPGRDGFVIKPSNSFILDWSFENLTTDREQLLADTAGTFVMRPNATPGVAGQVSFFSDANNLISEANLFYDSTNDRLGIGTNTPSVALHVVGSARITSLNVARFVKSDVNGNLSNALVSLSADVTGILPLANGGTSASLTAVAGGIVYSGASALAIAAAGTAGQALLSGGAAAPTWFASTGVVKAVSGVLSAGNVSLTTEVSGTLPVANGGTNSSTALNSNRIMVSSAGAIVEAAALTNGQLLIGSTGAAPVAANITQGANQGVVITNGAGSIALTTVQDIRTTATPTFAGQTLSGAGAFQTITDTTAACSMSTTMATVNTTDATITTLATVATTTDTVMLLEAKITGLRTGGSGGSAGDSGVYIRTARVKNVGGTVTIENLQSDFTSEDQGGFNATITASGTDALITVRGSSNNNMTWKAIIIKMV
jgi:hypothetical protein